MSDLDQQLRAYFDVLADEAERNVLARHDQSESDLGHGHGPIAQREMSKPLRTPSHDVTVIDLPQRVEIAGPLRRGRSMWAAGAVAAAILLVVGVFVVTDGGRDGVVTDPVSPAEQADPVLTDLPVTLSPFLAELWSAPGVDLFRVSSSGDSGAYWPFTTLDTFDGGIWGSSYSFINVAENGIVISESPDSAANVVESTITVSGLDDIWFPVPYGTTTFTGATAKWDPESGSFVTPAGELVAGTSYTVLSVAPLHDPGVLRLASPLVPTDINRRYTALPADFSVRVQDLAIEVTQREATPYDKAVALQDFFLSEFTYTTDVPLGHDVNRIEQFLFVERAGFSEQFAGTFAAMARAIGLPARVAVGFKLGDHTDDSFVVTGANYHAWPEIWIDGTWVPFEPTPIAATLENCQSTAACRRLMN